jgi:hypothetical protein
MKIIILIIALTATAHAGDDDRGNGRDKTRGGYAYSRETYSDTHTRDSDEWTQDTRPHTVPEPSSPLAMLVSAAVALVTRRSRGRGRWIREKRVDLRTVRFP